MLYEDDEIIEEVENNDEDSQSDSESSQSDSEYYSETVVPDSSCTYVYDANLNLVCVEDIVSNMETEETSEEEPSSSEQSSDLEGEEVASEETEEEETINYSQLTYEAFTEFSDNFNNFVDSYLDYSVSVLDFLGLFVVLYLISLLLSSFNSWRRSNR